MKYCKYCQQELYTSCFSPHPNTADKLSNKCKECVRTYNRARWAGLSAEEKAARVAQNRRLRHARWEAYSRADKCKAFRRKYGVRLAEYEEQWQVQNFCCAICKRERNKNEKAFAVDHCHKTGVVRGILCPQCNVDLGRIEAYLDAPEKIDDYLRKPPWLPMTPVHLAIAS